MAQQAVVFDYGRVLGGPSDAWQQAIERDYGIPPRTLGAFANEIEASVAGRPFSSEDMVPAMTARLLPLAGEKAVDCAARICFVFVDLSAHTLNQEVIALTTRLHRAGIALGILSNGPADCETTTIAHAAKPGCLTPSSFREWKV